MIEGEGLLGKELQEELNELRRKLARGIDLSEEERKRFLHLSAEEEAKRDGGAMPLSDEEKEELRELRKKQLTEHEEWGKDPKEIERLLELSEREARR